MDIKRITPVLLYSVLIAYGSLYPFQEWQWPYAITQIFSAPKWPDHLSKGDVIINILAYVPFGFLIAKQFDKRSYMSAKVLFIAVIIGSGISYLMECLQSLLPSRVSSISDVLMNGAGTFTGAVMAVALRRSSFTGSKLRKSRENWILPGNVYDLGLGVLFIWVLSQLAPFVPSVDWGNLKNGLKPLWYTVHDLRRFNFYEWAMYSLNITALGVIAALTVKAKEHATPAFASFIVVTLLLKITMVGRQLSLEALTGFFAGIILCVIICSLPRTQSIYAAVVTIVTAFVIFEVQPAKSKIIELHEFNWIPFRMHMSNLMTGFIDILESLWPFPALAYLAILMAPLRPKIVIIAGSMFVFSLVMGLEWLQKSIPGRYPDITQVILSAVGWVLPWLYVRGKSPPELSSGD